jgi:hypothetical protein
VYDTLEALHHLLAPHAVAVTPAGASACHVGDTSGGMSARAQSSGGSPQRALRRMEGPFNADCGCSVAALGIEEQPSWRALKAFHCSHNGISSMDPSLRLLPVLQVGERTCTISVSSAFQQSPAVGDGVSQPQPRIPSCTCASVHTAS